MSDAAYERMEALRQRGQFGPDQMEAADQLTHSFVPQTGDAFDLAVRCIKRGREVQMREAVVLRMEALVRKMAGDEPSDYPAEARAIVALLPEPVDPDLLAARDVVAATLNPAGHARCNCAAEILAGQWDRGHKVRAAIAAVKRGRQMGSGL